MSTERERFGIRLADHESVQCMLGEAAMQIEIGRLLVMKAAWSSIGASLRGRRSRWPRSRSPTRCIMAADTAIQLQGARGYSKDTVARVDLPLCPPGAAGRRRRRGAQDGAEPFLSRRG